MNECVSLIVKVKMIDTIDKWIDGRKKVLNAVRPDSEYAKITRELINNLEKSKKAIDKMKTCETK